MPPRKGIPKPKDLQLSSAPKPMQTFVVRASGSRNVTKITETKRSKEKARQHQDNPPEDNLIVLQQVITEDWEPEALREDDTPTEPPAHEVQLELEILMDDVHDGHGTERSTGKGQNEILDDWRSRYESLYLDEIVKSHSPPLNRCGWCGNENANSLRCDDCLLGTDACIDCFTFAVLREFYFLSTEGKVSASRFWAMLTRSSNNMKPHLHLNRFREFLGATLCLESREAQSLALRCPACPRLDVNHNMDDVTPSEEFLYTQQISYDGSFQLVRKNKASDEHDLCLSDGTKYWVNQSKYKAHLEANWDTAYQQSTRGADCNNHRAANDTWTRRAGVAESGVGAVTCARHTFYMPGGVVNYYKVSLLLKKYKEAVRMASETLAQWETIDKSIDASLRSEWEQMSILPQRIEGTSSFTSVFLSKEGSKTSMTRALLELNRLEADDESTPAHESGLTAPSWISEGIEIEHQQYQLLRDLKRYDSKMTDHQALDCFNRRSQLSSRIIRHREHAAMFVDVILTSSSILPSLAEETDGRPEIAALFLPSQLGKSLSNTERSRRAVKLEYQLRTVTCVRGIHRFKMAAIQKRNMTQGKQKNARGQNMNTRAQGMIDRLTARVDAAVWEYENSRKALDSIGMEPEDARIFKPLKRADVDELSRFLSTGRELGEGYRSPPWFWSMTSNGSDDDEASVEADINEGE
ncbi:hypothetical protein RhiJN_15063 [Ceratobasidium sp. AG-Ba]|nr:hypothetical protein RhiJN_15063 [Ceratobasidium sp. AG-Ba]